jgi:SNF2 family DNA or RNA helicase
MGSNEKASSIQLLLKPESILEGPFWPERIRVISYKQIGTGIEIQGIGVKSERFYSRILRENDLAKIKRIDLKRKDFSGDAESFFLSMEGKRIRFAFQFDPLYAVNVSQIDPLPHQIDAVYHYILKHPRIRFLLADDPGAGKTIMAGLVLKELKQRGLVEMAAYQYGGKMKRTERYKLGELLSRNSNFLLFLTATPHRGDPSNFRLFLDLLEPGFFATNEMLEESIKNKDNPLFLRRLKEHLKNFDNTPLFPPRKVITVKYRLSDDEKRLYNAVTEYVEKYYNKAMQKEKRNAAFALLILQRRLASSLRAIRRSLERRKERLRELHEQGRIIQEIGYIDEEAYKRR